MKSIILAGGTGPELWPLSRKKSPKQFLSFLSEKSFIQMVASLVSDFTDKEDIFVVTPEEYRFNVSNQISPILKTYFDNMILEPMPRNTAPAAALALKHLSEKKLIDEDEVLIFFPADHIIGNGENLKTAILESLPHAKESVVIFGIVPQVADSSSGYIHLGKELSDEFYNVEKFIEKPEVEKAEQYIESGDYLWNSGIFMTTARNLWKAFSNFCPSLHTFFAENDYEYCLKNFGTVEKISIDYALTEKLHKLRCRKVEMEWSDIGSWNLIYNSLPKDDQGNVIIGDVECIDVKNSLAVSKKNLIALIGVQDVTVIETEDAILVSKTKDSENVKRVVDLLRKKKRIEVEENITTYRPWGSYTILEEGPRYKIKKIVVNQGARLSLQRHLHRSEHWVVVNGSALVEIDNEEKYVHENESVYVPKSSLHRLSNPGKIPLEIIEVQSGEYLGEDDIERFEDKYGRV